jgi:hypothetical protein
MSPEVENCRRKLPKKVQPYCAGDTSPVHALGPTFLLDCPNMKTDGVYPVMEMKFQRRGGSPHPYLEEVRVDAGLKKKSKRSVRR